MTVAAGTIGHTFDVRVQKVQKGRFLGLTGPMGRRVLKFDGPLARGLWYRPSGDEFYNSAPRNGKKEQMDTNNHPASLSFRPKRSGVEKSPSLNGTSRIGAEISRLRVSIEPNTFALISTCSSARDDNAENSLLLFWAIF